ncbi:MAG: macro domain-containing protein [Candidatus Amoebophilus sp.]
MLKNTIIRYGIVLSMLLIQACNCGSDSSRTPDTSSGPTGNRTSQTTPKPNEKPKPDGKAAEDKTKNPSSITPWDITENIYKAAVQINQTDNWLNQLGIDKTKEETVVVNASNSYIKSPGGGIDGALGSWARANNTTPWTKPAPLLPNGNNAPDRLNAGEFALFSVSFGHIYLAIGPMASQVQSLKKSRDLIANLYYNILVQAKQDNKKCVVLCAISTQIFAADGKETDTGKAFTKAEFVINAYEGMKQGIAQFQQEDPKHTLKIILNNWDETVVDQVKPLTE